MCLCLFVLRFANKKTRMEKMSDLKTVPEVSEILRVQPATVRSWLRSGELTGIKTPAGWRISNDDIQNWKDFYRERRYRLSQGLTAQPD